VNGTSYPNWSGVGVSRVLVVLGEGLSSCTGLSKMPES
jgi:hypothetical protein